MVQELEDGGCSGYRLKAVGIGVVVRCDGPRDAM